MALPLRNLARARYHCIVSARWQRKWSRLSRMGWNELWTRSNQEFTKQHDLVTYRLGLNPSTPIVGIQKAPEPKFFFDDEGPKRRALLMCKSLPDQAEKIVREADNICHHRFHLLGYQNLQFGSEIDWHFDPIHEKHSPIRPWFKIDFLDFNKIGDHKIIWELNRHQHLVTLAKAWLLTDNTTYVQEIVRQWYGWTKANPYPLGINWASSLEVAFRSLSWLWVLPLAAGCSEFTDSFKNDLRSALCLSGRHIEKYLSTYFSPNTHLLGEAVALLFVGTLCPEISVARRWQSKGWKILLEESQRQVRSDGVYFEQTLYYHVYALDFFLHARRLAEVNGIPIPDLFDDTLRKMLNLIRALSEGGTLEGFGDDDGGRVFDPSRNRIEHMTDPLALGAVTYNCNRYLTFGLTEEAIWMFGEKAIEMLASSPTHSDQAGSKAFPSSGIYLMNDRSPAAQLMIDAGPQGTARSGHGHADALSVRFLMEGRRVLIDSGTGGYALEEERNLFRGTGAHNTLRVDNLDQAVPAGPFAWDFIPQTKTASWVTGQNFDFLSCEHNGYARLPEQVVHRRSVFHVKGGLWLVHDSAEGQGNHLLEIFWHFAPDLMATQEPGIVRIRAGNEGQDSAAATFAMLWDIDSRWTSQIVKSVVSPAYGLKQSAPVLRMSMEERLPQECGVVLLPFSASLGALTTLRGDEVGGYRYQTVMGTELIFFPRQNPWNCGQWSSDARFLYCKLEGKRLTHIITIDGSFAAWRGRRFVSRPGRSPSFEWLNSSPSTEDSQLDHAVESSDVLDLDFSDAAF